jgi:hypothetical protein
VKKFIQLELARQLLRGLKYKRAFKWVALIGVFSLISLEGTREQTLEKFKACVS